MTATDAVTVVQVWVLFGLLGLPFVYAVEQHWMQRCAEWFAHLWCRVDGHDVRLVGDTGVWCRRCGLVGTHSDGAVRPRERV